MIPRHDGMDYNIDVGDLSTTSGSSGTCFATGVNLPQGASIQSTATWYKSNASSDLEVAVWRHKHQTGSQEALFGGTVVDNSNTRKAVNHTVPAALRTVNNAIFDYSYWICLGPGTEFQGARIYYTYMSAGD